MSTYDTKRRQDDIKLAKLRAAAAIGFADVERGAFTTIAPMQARKVIAAIGRQALKRSKQRKRRQ